jgi:branched-chain amino acid transport system substrate-binding protein
MPPALDASPVDCIHPKNATTMAAQASMYASVLIAAECIRQAASLDSDSLRRAVSRLNCDTLYGRFQIDPRTGRQSGHRILLVRWQDRTKTVLPT